MSSAGPSAAPSGSSSFIDRPASSRRADPQAKAADHERPNRIGLTANQLTFVRPRHGMTKGQKLLDLDLEYELGHRIATIGEARFLALTKSNNRVTSADAIAMFGSAARQKLDKG